MIPSSSVPIERRLTLGRDYPDGYACVAMMRCNCGASDSIAIIKTMADVRHPGRRVIAAEVRPDDQPLTREEFARYSVASATSPKLAVCVVCQRQFRVV